MLIADMIHSCSNAEVAQAAVSSIGGSFADRVNAAAVKNGVNVGRFVSVVMRDFARRANQDTLLVLRGKIAGADQPLLLGLIQVVEPALQDEARFFYGDELTVPAGVLHYKNLCDAMARLH